MLNDILEKNYYNLLVVEEGLLGVGSCLILCFSMSKKMSMSLFYRPLPWFLEFDTFLSNICYMMRSFQH